MAGALVFLYLTLVSCAPSSRPSRASSAPAGPIVIGEVAIVDEEKRFVLIDLDSNLYVPPPGTPLRTRNASSVETGRLQASPEQKRPFIAADILDGNPAVGDQVLR